SGTTSYRIIRIVPWSRCFAIFCHVFPRTWLAWLVGSWQRAMASPRSVKRSSPRRWKHSHCNAQFSGGTGPARAGGGSTQYAAVAGQLAAQAADGSQAGAKSPYQRPRARYSKGRPVMTTTAWKERQDPAIVAWQKWSARVAEADAIASAGGE